MEENLEKQLNNIFLDIINKKLNNIEIYSEEDIHKELLGFSCSELEIGDDYISTVYGIPKINYKEQQFDTTLFNWIMALLNYLKNNNLLDDFKQFYT